MSFSRQIAASFRPLVDTLFPPACWVDPQADNATFGLSDAVRMRIAEMAAQRYCRACGLTTGPYSANDADFKCGRCGERVAGVMRIARVGTFDEPLVALVHRLKFARTWEVARVIAPFLYQAIAAVSEGGGVPVDALLPVPLHWTRRARRGFNQAEELARETAKLGGWQVLRPLKRIRRTVEQARIQAPSRRAENLQRAFFCKADGGLAGRHVWLIDDVSTTGATLHAAATAMRKLPKDCRPASINAAVICVTDHGSPPAGDVASASRR